METMLVSRIHMVNQMEIKAGEMAAQKGSAFDVREYGDRLRMDHSVADAKILSYAKAHGLKIMSPDEIQSKMQQMSGQIPEAEALPQQMEQQGMSAQSGTPPAQQFEQQMTSAKSMMQQLQGLQGKAFDAAFTQFMEKGHTKAIAMLSMAEHMLPANDGLRSLLGKMVPILVQHYDIASHLQIATVRRQNQELGDKLNAKMTKMKGGQ